MTPAPALTLEALDKVDNIIVRDYALEIAVLLIGAYSKVGGLREFCALAALLLTIDCAAMGTFYVAILSIMIEVRITPWIFCELIPTLFLSFPPHQDVPVPDSFPY